ncbi:phage tail protein [Sphingomonas sp. CJ20]
MEPFFGQIIQVGFSYAPSGWLNCNGASIPIAQNQALFTLLGTNFGGDGRTSFCVPDARGRALIGTGSAPSLTSRSLGDHGGQEQTTLTVSQLPPHTHTATFASTGSPKFTGALTAIAGLEDDQTAEPAAGSYLGSAADEDVSPTFYVPADKANAQGTQVSLAGVTGSISGIAGTVDVALTGAGSPVSTMPPFLAVTTIIATTGFYPPRE